MPPAGIDVASSGRGGFCIRSSRYRVMSSAPWATSTPLNSPILAASRSARITPRVGMPSSTTRGASATVQCGLFDDLVRDAGNGATHVGRRHQFPAGGGVTRSTHTRPDLLLRLSGRIVKGCRLPGSVASGIPADDARPAAGRRSRARHFTCATVVSGASGASSGRNVAAALLRATTTTTVARRRAKRVVPSSDVDSDPPRQANEIPPDIAQRDWKSTRRNHRRIRRVNPSRRWPEHADQPSAAPAWHRDGQQRRFTAPDESLRNAVRDRRVPAGRSTSVVPMSRANQGSHARQAQQAGPSSDRVHHP